MISSQRLSFVISQLSICFILIFVLGSSISHADWLEFVSEEQQNSPARCPSGFVDGVECRGRYCDNISLSCVYTSSVGRQVDYGRFISDGGDNEFQCQSGFLINGVKCRGKYCDDLAFSCVEVPAGTGSCKWEQGYYSEEQGRFKLPDGKYLAGVRCFGSYCDTKQYKLCSTNKPIVKAINGYWKLIDSCVGVGCSLTQSVTVGISSQDSRSKSTEWGQSITASVSATAGGDAEGGSVTVGVSATLSKSETDALTKALSKSYETQSSVLCQGDPSASVRAIYQYQFQVDQVCAQRGNCDPTMIGTHSTVCVSDPPHGAANYLPSCKPNCCKDALCSRCETGGVCSVK